MGFPVPFAQWTRDRWQPAVRDVLLDRRTRERGLINAVAVEHLLDAHRNGTANGGDAIWALVNLELWYRTFIDGDGVQTLTAPRTSEPRTSERRTIERRTIEQRSPEPQTTHERTAPL
jgi:asparagine synthase (glutamine-hydrolysing)